jgi:hypothetical protein
MKIVVCSNPAPEMSAIDGKYDLALVCGICPTFDPHLITWNIINSVDYIEQKFNPWLHGVDAAVRVVIGGPRDHIAEFYGAQMSYYMPGEYLQDDMIVAKGLNIYAMPWYLPYEMDDKESGAFRARTKEFMNVAIDSIPDETDILLTNTHAHHCAEDVLPYFQGDQRLGNRLASLKRLKLLIHSNRSCEAELNQPRKYLTICASRETIGSSTVIHM